MTEPETQLILEIWESFKPHVPKGKREGMAIKLLKMFEDLLVSPEELELAGEDEYLDSALEKLYTQEFEGLAGHQEVDDWNEYDE